MTKYTNVLNFIFIGIFLMFITIGIQSKLILHPDKVILGSWDDHYWNFVKIQNLNKLDTLKDIRIDENTKQTISSNSAYHNTVEWLFKDDAVLLMRKKNNTYIKAKWRLTGRGHILKIVYNDNSTDLFRIVMLNKKHLVLSFENSIHIRGIIHINLTNNK